MISSYGQGHLDDNTRGHFFMLFYQFYAHVSENQRITSENLSDGEKQIAQDFASTFYRIGEKFEVNYVPNPSDVISGLHIFRFELLPQILNTVNIAQVQRRLIFQAQFRVEHSYLHVINDNAVADHCRFRTHQTLAEADACETFPEHCAAYFEYELKD